MKISLSEGATIAKWVVIAGVALYVYKRGFAALGDAAGTVLTSLDPTNNENIINRGATSVYQGITGSTGNMGGDFYDWTHPPGTENTNIINGGATSIYRSLTGSSGTMGGDLYDWLH